jgi:hypothetical protein
MSQSAIVGALWEDFTSIFWIAKYLQRPIYVWNKNSNRIMCKCGLNYQIDILHIVYSNQHFEPIEYTFDVKNTQFQFETQNSKLFINLDDYPMLSRPMKQEMQTLAQKICFNWNDDLDCVLIKLLETYANAPLEYIVQVFNSSFNTNVIKTYIQ